MRLRLRFLWDEGLEGEVKSLRGIVISGMNVWYLMSNVTKRNAKSLLEFKPITIYSFNSSPPHPPPHKPLHPLISHNIHRQAPRNDTPLDIPPPHYEWLETS